MSLMFHAKKELDLIGMKEDSEDEMDTMMRRNILEVVEIFSKQGHSGFSAGEAINILDKLLRFQNLSPLTGEDDEWMDMSEYCDGEPLWQNIRCYNVFKTPNECYDINGRVFVDKDGYHYTNAIKSRVPVTFPYTPHTEYVNDTDISELIQH